MEDHLDDVTPHPRDVTLRDTSGQLLLVPLHRADLAELAEVLDRTFTDPALGWRMYDLDRASDAVRLMASAHGTRNAVFWAVLCDQQTVGVFGVTRHLGTGGGVATTTYLDGPVRGTGLNGELKNLVRDGAAQGGVRLVASVARDNLRSNAAMRSLVAAEPTPVTEPCAPEVNLYTFPLSPSASGHWPARAVDIVAGLLEELTGPQVLAA